jgi:uncharacterized protein (TIGR02118 family)
MELDSMIKVSVLYPYQENARFDHDYYRDTHLPLVSTLMGEGLRKFTIDKGVSGGLPGTQPPYIGMCHLFCESFEIFQKSFGPHAEKIYQDIGNYTDIAPVIQVSEIVEVN